MCIDLPLSVLQQSVATNQVGTQKKTLDLLILSTPKSQTHLESIPSSEAFDRVKIAVVKPLSILPTNFIKQKILKKLRIKNLVYNKISVSASIKPNNTWDTQKVLQK